MSVRTGLVLNKRNKPTFFLFCFHLNATGSPLFLLLCWINCTDQRRKVSVNRPLGFFRKTHTGVIDKSKYLTPTYGWRQSRASHVWQWTLLPPPLPPTPGLPFASKSALYVNSRAVLWQTFYRELKIGTCTSIHSVNLERKESKCVNICKITENTDVLNKDKWRYPGNATLTKHNLPEEPKEWEMRNK